MGMVRAQQRRETGSATPKAGMRSPFTSYQAIPRQDDVMDFLTIGQKTQLLVSVFFQE